MPKGQTAKAIRFANRTSDRQLKHIVRAFDQAGAKRHGLTSVDHSSIQQIGKLKKVVDPRLDTSK